MSDYVVKQVPKEAWRGISENAYAAAFGHHRDDATLRYDFALLVVDQKTDLPAGYTTATEESDEILRWKFGGGFAPVKGRTSALRALTAMVDWHRGRYKHVVTLIKNDNLPSLKIHMAAGFRIFGVHHFKDETFCELVLSLEA